MLKTHPNLKRVRVESHVDETGMTEREQLDLSKAQASTVVSALVQRGVEELRVIPEGFGPRLFVFLFRLLLFATDVLIVQGENSRCQPSPLLIQTTGNSLCFAPSDTSDGRALNRRMDFLIVEDDANPKGMKRLSSSGRLGDLASGPRRSSLK